MKRIRRALPAGAGLFFLDAALFLVGAVNAASGDLQETMQVGSLEAAAATGIAYVFVTGGLGLSAEARKATAR